MAIILGGSGSTGSSLLANILNRQSQIFCGQESYLFAKKALYYDWDNSKFLILKKGLKNEGWHLLNGVFPEYEVVNWNPNELRSMIEKSRSFKEFIDHYYFEILHETKKDVWAEKTPSNAHCFPEISEFFPEAKLIHCVRNPLDAISSLMNRGFDVYYSTALYLINTAEALRMVNTPFYKEIKYEDLVEKPLETTTELFDFLALRFDEKSLKGKDSNEPEISSWNYSEQASIHKGSINRFDNDDEEKQTLIVTSIYQMRITDNYAVQNEIVLNSIPEICDYFGYELPSAKDFKSLNWLDYKYRLKRVIRNYKYTFQNYPIELI